MKSKVQKNNTAGIRLSILAVFVFLLSACGATDEVKNAAPSPTPQTASTPAPLTTPTPIPGQPDLQAEILDGRFKSTGSPLGTFDFKDHTYPLPRGWQDPDGSDAQLDKGERRMTGEKIGLSYVSTRFFDVTGDGQEEAFVILKIVTAGSAIPQLVYVFSWKDGQPELIWYFRTGDRADGGLKDLRPEEGMLLVEIYGQDRFLLGEVETGKITGDEEQLCCPTHFTRTRYKWNGKNFLMQGKRMTHTVADPSAPPVENLGDIVNDPKYQQQQQKKK